MVSAEEGEMKLRQLPNHIGCDFFDRMAGDFVKLNVFGSEETGLGIVGKNLSDFFGLEMVVMLMCNDDCDDLVKLW